MPILIKYWAGLLLACCTLTCAALSPLGIPDTDDIEYPDDAPHSAEEVKLGKLLFFDTRLSINQQQSCASCHNPDLGFSDGLKKGIGAKGNTLSRHTPSLYNLAWNVVFFWDGRSRTMEEQALAPIVNPEEMAMPLGLLVTRLNEVTYYRRTFKQIYHEDRISKESIARALSAFQRSLITNNSPFDQYMAGNNEAMSPEALRGLTLFKNKANCIACHDGPNFTDNSFHNIGIDDNDPGRAKVINDASLTGAFKTPSLRNVALSAPYMHDGSEPSLESVIRFYNRGGDKKQHLSELIKPLDLTEQEIMDLVAFLAALTSPVDIQRPMTP